MYDKTITILNKLKKSDIVGATTDLWKKTILTNAEFRKTLVKSVSGNTVSMGESIVILIPFSEDFKTYDEWKKTPESGYTMSQGDMIFLGIALEENPTSATITSIKNLHEPNVCDVRSVQIAEKNGLANVQLRIDGV